MDTPKKNILAYLLNGGRLTVVKAREMFHTTELRKTISRLKRDGYPVCSEWRYTLTDYGRKTRFKEYYLAG